MKTPAELDAEISSALSNQVVALNTGNKYLRIDRNGSMSVPEHRWIGRCPKCGKTHRLEGHLMMGVLAPLRLDDPRAVSRRDLVIQADDGSVFTTASMGTDTADVWIKCGDHHCKLRRVIEGTKKSKHECGARCMNATGPNCDCKCKGQNHGSNC